MVAAGDLRCPLRTLVKVRSVNIDCVPLKMMYFAKCLFAFPYNFMLQEAIVKIMKMRKRITNAALQTELVEILRNMFLPSKKLIKEQIEWLIEHKYMKRDEENINMFIYMA